MACSATHILKVVVLARDAHALLAARRADIVARFFAEEGSLEGDHARIHEHQGRIGLRHERCTRNAAVATLLEVAKKSLSNLPGWEGHGGTSNSCVD